MWGANSPIDLTDTAEITILSPLADFTLTKPSKPSAHRHMSCPSCGLEYTFFPINQRLNPDLLRPVVAALGPANTP